MGNNISSLILPHRKISDDEVSSLLEKYSLISKLKLPRIKAKDPALAELEVKGGDVIEIVRHSFAGESKYYRVVED